jgi:hypothetical protein
VTEVARDEDGHVVVLDGHPSPDAVEDGVADRLYGFEALLFDDLAQPVELELGGSAMP